MSTGLNKHTGFGGYNKHLGQSPTEMFYQKQGSATKTIEPQRKADPGKVINGQTVTPDPGSSGISDGRSFYLYVGLGLIIFYVIYSNRE